MREAIQLQFGPVSNLVGVELLDLLVTAARGPTAAAALAHDVMLGRNAEPRLVAFDSASAFQQPTLDPDDRHDIQTWTGTRSVHHLPASAPPAGVESWTTTLAKAGLELRPPSLVRLSSAGGGGDLFQHGLEAIGPVLDDALDAVRRQIEKCDAFETIHTLADADSMHGAVAAVVLEQVRDDFCTSRQTLITLPIWTAASRRGDADALVNRMLACARLYECSGALVFDDNRHPTVEMDVASRAMALYAGSICYRLSSSSFSSGDLLRALLFDPALRFASLQATVDDEGRRRRCRGQYRVAAGVGADTADCVVPSPIAVGVRSSLARGRRPASRLARHVPVGVVAEWTSAEPTFDRVLRLARIAQELRPAMASARYGLDADTVEQVRESYLAFSDAITSYRDPGF